MSSKTRFVFPAPADADARGVVYALEDPRTNEIRYIGRTMGCLRRRALEHVQDANLRTKNRKNSWVKAVLGAGCALVVWVLEHGSSNVALNEAEVFFISYFRSIGARLTNLTDGGGGCSGHRFSDEVRARMSEYWKGRKRGPRSDETRIAVSRGKGGRPIIRDDGVRFETMADAARSIDVLPKYISPCVHGRTYSVKGRRFRFEGESFSLTRQSGRAIFDENGVRYNSMKEVANTLGCSTSFVSMVIKGKRKSAKGHVLRWADGLP